MAERREIRPTREVDRKRKSDARLLWWLGAPKGISGTYLSSDDLSKILKSDDGTQTITP